jgi:Protein of unknown function DUF262
VATTLFRDTTYSTYGLIESIKRGAVALPDIQQPFVWSASKVRDLLDSMYKEFPVGYLLFWETGADPGARQMGVGDKQAVPALLIVDGQQRLTSLYAVMTGSKVVRQDYTEARSGCSRRRARLVVRSVASQPWASHQATADRRVASSRFQVAGATVA